VHTKDVNYKGYIHHASEDDPQYEIKSERRNGESIRLTTLAYVAAVVATVLIGQFMPV
jgi:hypothetical protein